MSVNEFDAKARTWDLDPVRVKRAEVVAEAIRLELPMPRVGSALEFGCGTGLVSFSMQPYCDRIVMADSSKEMLDVLAEKIRAAGVTNMVPVELDLTRSGATEEKFDIIYTLLTLHHVAETEALIGVFRTMLKDGGVLYIADLDKEDGSFHGEGFNGHNGFEREALVKQAEHAGFTSVSIKTVTQLERVVAGGEKKTFPLFLLTAKK